MTIKRFETEKGRRTTPDSSIDKDEGISDDMDDMSVSELRLQLELNEQVIIFFWKVKIPESWNVFVQETAVLRRKMEDMEGENDRLSLEVAELQQLAKATTSVVGTGSKGGKELETLKNQLLEKNKEIQHLSEALTQSQKSKKVVVQRSRSLEGESALDLKVKTISCSIIEVLDIFGTGTKTEAAATCGTRGGHFASQNSRSGGGEREGDIGQPPHGTASDTEGSAKRRGQVAHGETGTGR